MKKIFFSGFFLLLFLAGNISAQSLDDKEWAKKLKSMKPNELRELVEKNEELESKVRKLESENKSQDAELARLKKELEDYSAGSAPSKTVSNPSGSNVPVIEGLIYKVQIGAFKNKNLSKYLDNHKNFSGDIDKDGTRKYTLGHFEDYWEADRFKKYLREMGVKDAWVVPYKDGNRISMKDALEGNL
ncbi:Ezrin/radixin/moesin family protein [Cytophagaceae bacterium ABcell3]|nr:Ezrin/radixin/moesin family protein [Cytophagaceae bacterium ABcell3]